MKGRNFILHHSSRSQFTCLANILEANSTRIYLVTALNTRDSLECRRKEEEEEEEEEEERGEARRGEEAVDQIMKKAKYTDILRQDQIRMMEFIIFAWKKCPERNFLFAGPVLHERMFESYITAHSYKSLVSTTFWKLDLSSLSFS